MYILRSVFVILESSLYPGFIIERFDCIRYTQMPRLQTCWDRMLFASQKQVIRVKNSWGLLPRALESIEKHWSVSAQLNIH